MLFRHIYDDDLAQASYLVGCERSGEAVVVDPRRDVEPLLAAAATHGLRVTGTVDTHVHADYASGARELAVASGARLYASACGGDAWSLRVPHVGLRDGDVVEVGRVRLLAVHTPGHTPEHLSFLIHDTASSEEASLLLSGDFVFVGDVGRPDLLDAAAGYRDTRRDAARTLFASLRDRFLTLPDYVQVWPGHGAGSACGKALGSVPSTTVGFERRTAWWVPYVEEGDIDGFVGELLDGQPDVPRYFGRMKRVNREGPPLLGPRPEPRRLERDELDRRLGRDLVLLDTRSPEEHRRDHVPGALLAPEGARFTTYASYVVDPERDGRGIVLLAADADAAETMRVRLARIGVDRVEGWIPSLAGLTAGPVALVPPEGLDLVRDRVVVDVRSSEEVARGAIPGAVHLPVGAVASDVLGIDPDRTLVVHCQRGSRASIAASVLRARGHRDVRELEGSFAAWEERVERAGAA